MSLCSSNNSSYGICNNSTIPTTSIPVPSVSTGKHRLHGVEGWDDATWVLSSSFIIFTMQSGFGLLESGMVSRKNEVGPFMVSIYLLHNYMIAMVCDGSKGGGGGVVSSGALNLTAIEWGGGAERGEIVRTPFKKLLNGNSKPPLAKSCIYPRLMPFVAKKTSRGLGPMGGVMGLVATIILKPRLGRFSRSNPLNMSMGSPVTAILGLFVLWWGWLGFNCGSTFGITGGKWQLAASYIYYKRKVDVTHLIVGILGGLVSVTGICPLAHPWESLIIGAVGGCCSCFGRILMFKLKFDDPTSCIAVHTLSGVWGLIAVGLFVEVDHLETFSVTNGIFKGGNGHLLGVQLLAVVVLAAWSAVTSALILLAIKLTIGLRVTEEEEKLGADQVEHEMDYKKVERPKQSALRGLNLFLQKIEPLRSPRVHKKRTESDLSRSFAIKIKTDDKDLVVESVGSDRERSSSHSLQLSANLPPSLTLIDERRQKQEKDEIEGTKKVDPAPVIFLPKSPID
ncbi:hypothetical protein QZH41_007647 [Actinostola sp. cb2023]|nr:hypothetical protein QZH41_007647 [Actinostola sp. cb2023]